MQKMITADAVKTLSRGPHKDYSWYLLEPAVWLDRNPISGPFCNCENTLKSWSQAAGWAAHAWCSLGTARSRADRRWQMGCCDTADLWGIHYPPTDTVWWQQRATYKGRREGEGGICERMMVWRYSARQQAYNSFKGGGQAWVRWWGTLATAETCLDMRFSVLTSITLNSSDRILPIVSLKSLSQIAKETVQMSKPCKVFSPILP